MKVLILNGFPRSGKDEFVQAIEDRYQVFLHSTVDKVKFIASEFLGWNGEKTPEMRNMLSELKDLYTKYFDGPFNDIKKNIELSSIRGDDFLFLMIREPEEIEKVVSWCKENNYDCHTILCLRPGVEENNHCNTGDSGVLKYSYDHTLVNNSSLDNWRKLCVNFIKHHIEGSE